MAKERNETVIGSRLGEFEERRSKQKVRKCKTGSMGGVKWYSRSHKQAQTASGRNEILALASSRFNGMLTVARLFC